MTDQDTWPAPLDSHDPELKKETFAGRLELLKQRAESEQATSQAEAQAELDTKTEYYKSIFEVAKGSVDRARSGAQSVQTVAGTIVTLYTGLLAVTFAAASRPLPPRGVVPAVLLGVSVVLSTGYLAYLRSSDDREVAAPAATSSRRSAELARARSFIRWTRSAATKRSYWLRASVLAFGFAIMLLPAPFVALGKVDLGIVTFGKDVTQPKTTAGWPAIPTGSQNIELQKIRYAAEVKEAAAARSGNTGAAKDGADAFWFAVGGLALAISLTPLIRRSQPLLTPDTPHGSDAAATPDHHPRSGGPNARA